MNNNEQSNVPLDVFQTEPVGVRFSLSYDVVLKDLFYSVLIVGRKKASNDNISYFAGQRMILYSYLTVYETVSSSTVKSFRASLDKPRSLSPMVVSIIVSDNGTMFVPMFTA